MPNLPLTSMHFDPLHWAPVRTNIYNLHSGKPVFTSAPQPKVSQLSTYAVVAAKTSTGLAFVRRPRQRVKMTVKPAINARRPSTLLTKYKTVMAAIGNREEKHIETIETVRRRPSCE